VVTKSSPKRYTQRQLTEVFLTSSNIPVQQLSTWQRRIWFNPVDNESLRLNLIGYQFLMDNVKLKGYEYTLKSPLSSKNLIQLERYFQGPYYLFQNKKIIVFDETEASMLSLMDGDLRSYLDNLEINT
jgi:hypothetical protein